MAWGWLDFLLRVEGSQGAVGHAVDGPVGVAVLVADGDREAAVVGPQQVDHLPGVVARQRQRRPLARVRRPVLPLFCCNNKTKQKYKNHFKFQISNFNFNFIQGS